jgi:glycosyltransferase involved in cell wall biosynthesis
MSTPLISTIIPTFRRPKYLPRAVSSALEGFGDDAEIIVVPNGPDDSWKRSMAAFFGDRRVRIEPVATPHANVARNHGLRKAQGKYLRFLDDDDYLLPASIEQVELLEIAGAEICSGRIENVNEDGGSYGLLTGPASGDFVCAAVAFSGFALPTAHVFLRSCLADCSWDAKLDRRQDYGWMLDLASHREWNWIHHEKPVGAWFQHRGARISHARFMEELDHPVLEKIFNLHAQLSKTGRQSQARNTAIATALWHHVHLGFPYHPIYWTRIARQAKIIASEARPPDPMFTTGLMKAIDPVIGEWMLLPVRNLRKMLRHVTKFEHDVDHERHL